MIAIFAEQISCSGDTHEYVVAVFTTQEKADAFLARLKDYFPKEYFYIADYFEPKVDPDFDVFIVEGSHPVPMEEDSEMLELLRKLETP